MFFKSFISFSDYQTTCFKFGKLTDFVNFEQGINADMAAVNVQNRVNGALSQLPAEATKTGVTMKSSRMPN